MAKLLIFFLLFICSICSAQQKPREKYIRSAYTTANSVTSTSSSSSSNSSGGLAIFAFLLIFALCQVCLFIFCYWNTKRLKKKSDLIRQRIGEEYWRIRDEQYINHGANCALRLNYYLVDPQNPIYQVWNGGQPINYQQPIYSQPGQQGNFTQIYQGQH